MSFQPDLPLIIASILTIFLTVSLVKKQRRSIPLPPGPPGWPILGNALDMMGSHPWIKYTEWSKHYGDVVHISAAGQHVIILNSPKALFDLLEQRGSIYSDRPRLIMGGELAGYVDSVPLSPYGNRLRECRKLMFEYLTARKVEAFYKLEEEKTREFLVDLLRTPEDFLHHIRRNIAAIVFQITHGHNLEEGEDSLLRLAEQADADFSATASPGAFMVDAFPILAYLPHWLNFDWMKKAKKYRRNMEAFVHQPYDAVKEQMTRGVAKSSFVLSLLERNCNPTKAQEYIYKWTTAGFYGGGADTTVSAIGSFFLAMSLNPEVQRKAQAEVRRVVGQERLPDFSDRPHLPYVEALMNEVYRLNPVGPTALPHLSTKDDVYNGYFIPQGSIIIPNSWAVLHDPEVYPSPFKFNPERYFQGDTTSKRLNPDPRRYAFGYGRRVCPGQHLADNSLFIVIAMVLAVFDVLPADKETPEPDFSKSEGYTSSTICHPEPFSCRIIPSSSEAVTLINANNPKEDDA